MIQNLLKKILFVVFCLYSPTLVIGHSYDPPGRTVRTIVIDPGHGGKDTGTSGARVLEKSMVLDIALKLEKAIKEQIPDIKVIMTRRTDIFIELYQRIDIANANKADLFISLHCNSVPRRGNYRSVHGTETFVSGFHRLGQQDAAIRENASLLLEENYKENYHGFDPKDPESYIVFSLMKNQYRDQSIHLASLLQENYSNSGRFNRGVKEQSLAVLAKAGMPAVLTELGFLSNPGEEQYIRSEAGQKEIVQNIVNAIKTYKKRVEQ